MTIQDFVSQNNGQSLDYDGAYGAQCVDLAQFWASALGTHHFTGNAIDIINQGNDADYVTIMNAPDNCPVPGDIVVWAANNPTVGTGPYGHVDICVSADVNSLTTFDQNWVHVYAHEVSHPNYAGVVGWLHPRVLDAPAPAPVAPQPAPEPSPQPETPAPAPATTPDPSTPAPQEPPVPATPEQPVPPVEVTNPDSTETASPSPVSTVKPSRIGWIKQLWRIILIVLLGAY